MTDPRDTITIPRRLALRLLGQMEELAECQHLERRSAKQIADAADMPDSYYKLREALWPPFKDEPTDG